jgi:hypothetical protein
MLRREDGLNRIDDDSARPLALDFVENVFEVRLRQQKEVRGLDAEPLAAHLYLPLRLLARDVEHALVLPTQLVRDLQQQR